MRTLLTTFILAVLAGTAVAQTGSISGTITENGSGQPAAFANVLILNSGGKGASSDFDGKFTIENVPAGSHRIAVSYVGFVADTVSVNVVSGQTAKVNFQMKTNAEVLKEFKVEARQNKRNAAFMTETVKKSPSVITMVGADQIAANGDNDAAAAAKRTTGVTVEGGKYIYVRGLSDRYSKATLNGAEIPGLDPNRNSVQMDLFPASMIENLTVTKAFTPDLPASFTGGLINIQTRDFPDRLTLNFSTSVSYNTNASFNSDFLTYEGGSTDFLGVDDGTRAVPSAVPSIVPTRFDVTNANWASELSNIGSAFNTTYDVGNMTPGLNRRVSFDVGNEIKFGSEENQRRIGFITGINYSQSFESFTNGVSGRYKLTGSDPSIENLNTEEYLTDSKSTENTLWGALLNTSLQLNDNNTVGFTFIRNQNGISSARYLEGSVFSDAQDLFIQTRQLTYTERAMSTLQFKGDHTTEKMQITWTSTYTSSNVNTPDLRFFSNDYTLDPLSENDTIYDIQAALYIPSSRYYRELNETNFDNKINVRFPFTYNDKDAYVKVGLSNVNKQRTASERRFDLKSNGVNYDGNMDNYLAAENFQIDPAGSYLFYEGYGGTTGNDRTNSYIGSENVAAAYGMIDIYLTPLLRVVAGTRVEQTLIESRSLNPEKPVGDLDNFDVLPSLNTSYQIGEKQILRGAYTRTLARPTFRELAPFAAFDFELRTTILGNELLERTLIDNIDLRWELYPNRGELITVGVFYKQFQNPIERVFNPIAANLELQYRNVDQATVYGAEFEFRKGLGNVSEKLRGFSVGGNFTYVFSQVNIAADELAAIREVVPDAPSTRNLFGQSPYIVNAYVGYKNDSIGLNTNISFNVSGPRMVVVGVKGAPDVFEQPRPSLNWNISKTINQRLSMKLSINNILDPETVWSQEFKGTEYVYQSWTRGRTIGLSLKYKLLRD